MLPTLPIAVVAAVIDQICNITGKLLARQYLENVFDEMALTIQVQLQRSGTKFLCKCI